MTIIRLTVAQMRRSAPRLFAAGLAIAIATGFVAATVLVTKVVDQTARATASERYLKAGLVLTSPERPLTAGDVAAARKVGQVRSTSAVVAGSANLSALDPAADPAAELVNVALQAEDAGYPADPTRRFTGGHAPRTSAEIAIDSSAAARLDLTPGEAVWLGLAGGEAKKFAVSGVFAREGSSKDPLVVATPGALEPLAQQLAADDASSADDAAGEAGQAWPRTPGDGPPQAGEGPLSFSRVFLDTGTSDPAAAQQAVAAQAGPDVTVRTRAEQTERDLDQFLGTIDVMVGFVAGFVAVALFVAGLVIANTFQVLIASRTRTLALERCLGATRAQVRRSVLFEAALLGLAASLAGILLGTALTQGVLWLVRQNARAVVPETITPSWLLLAAPLTLGLAVTLLAALLPAHLATRVSPLEALRPLQPPAPASPIGRARLGISLAAITLGTGVLALAVAASRSGLYGSKTLVLLAVGVGGAIVLVIGVLLSAVFWLPAIVRLAGRVLGRPGTDTQMAATNALRNPRRTAATSLALVIAVGLIAVVSTGADMARATLGAALRERFPVDMAIWAQPGEPGAGVPVSALPADLPGKIAGLNGVEQATAVTGQSLQLTPQGTGQEPSAWWVAGVDPGQLAATMPGPAARQLAEGKALGAHSLGPAGRGGAITLSGPGGTWHGRTGTPYDSGRIMLPDVLVPASVMAQVAPSAPVTGMLLKLAPDADYQALTDRVRDLATTTQVHGGKTLRTATVQLAITGGFETRRAYEAVISTMLLVVLGLLAIAVVIALVGVANTLSLSIRERRRETAVLRALGLTRRRLRRQLAFEGMLIAGTGALTGVLLGVALGWAGASVLLVSIGAVQFALPWGTIASILLIALAAGALASILPARRASRTPPTQALAAE